MRRLHTRVAWPLVCLTFAAALLAGANGQDAPVTVRAVEITVDSAQKDKVLPELGKLGFVANNGASGTVLSGRLPQGALEKAASLSGVERVLCGPPTPATGHPDVKGYQARLRCRLDSDKLQRAQQWRGLVKRLEAAGFKKAKGWDGEEFYADTIEGTLPASGLAQLHKERQLVTSLLVPEGAKLPDDASKPQMIRFHLTPDFGPPNQKEVEEKTREMLKPLGWKPAVGFDNHDHQRLMGWLPAGQLDALLRGKISTVARDREDLVIEMPLPNEANPLLTAGNVVVPFTLHYEPGTKRDDFIKSLEPYHVELTRVDDPQQATRRYVTGRVSTRRVNDLRQVDNFRALDVDARAARLRVHPIIRMDLLTEPEGSEPPGDPAEPAKPSKISNALRQHAGQADAANKLMRVEVVLKDAPPAGDTSWMGALQGDQLVIEGRVGPLVTGLIAPSQLEQLATSPSVSTLRLPATARSWALPPVDANSATNLPVLYWPLGRRGEATANLAQLAGGKDPRKSAVVASDFRGYEAFVGKQLPKNTQVIDFTGERSAELKPDPQPDDGKTIGAGTQMALALMAVAPAKELLLVRTATDAPYQIAKLVNCTEGKQWQSAALDRRVAELQHERGRLRDRASSLSVERKLALDDFSDDTLLRTIDNGFKTPLANIRTKFLAGEIEAEAAKKECMALKLSEPYVDTYLNLWRYQKSQAEFDREQAAYEGKLARQQVFVRDAAKLQGVSTVLSCLWWPEGHPRVNGQEGMRFLDLDRGPNAPIASTVNWIQMAPQTPGQTWHGLFRDRDRDDAMEFATSTDGKRPEVNFLAWRPHSWSDLPGAKQPKLVWGELPAGANVEVTLQWYEMHDPVWKGNGDDFYRQSLAGLKLVVLKQRDPAGKLLPADAFNVVATSSGMPDRIENDNRTAVYQAKATFTVPEGGGRYAIRIEGKQPDSVLPTVAAPIPNAPKFELQPKLRVDVIDPATRGKGRVIFQGVKE